MKKLGKILYPIAFLVLSFVFSEGLIFCINQTDLDWGWGPIIAFVLVLLTAVIGGWCSYRYAKVYLREGKYRYLFSIYSAFLFYFYPAGMWLLRVNYNYIPISFLLSLPFWWCLYLSYRGMKSAEKDSSEKSKKLWDKKYDKKETETPKDENTPQE